MKILISGVAGFIGSNLAQYFLNKGHFVIGFDDLSKGIKSRVPKGVKFYEADLSRSAEIFYRYEDIDFVIHCAAQTDVRFSLENPVEDCWDNVLGTLDLLDAFHNSKATNFVMFSTGGAVYGDADEIPTPESENPKPISPYAISKLACENYVKFYSRKKRKAKSTMLDKTYYTIVRLGNVYGPNDNKSVIALFDKALKGKKQVEIRGDGKQIRDYVHVSDVCSAVEFLLNKNLSGVFNIGTEVGHTVLDIAKKLAKKYELKTKDYIKYIPSIDGEVKKSILDTCKINSNGWEASINLDDGIYLLD